MKIQVVTMALDILGAKSRQVLLASGCLTNNCKNAKLLGHLIIKLQILVFQKQLKF